jgi:twitching motility protein PilT
MVSEEGKSSGPAGPAGTGQRVSAEVARAATTFGVPQVRKAKPEGAEGVSGPRGVEDVHIDEFLRIVYEKNASDLHICKDSEPIIRIDGALHRLNYQKLSGYDTQRLMYDVLTDEQIQRFESTLELDFSYELIKTARFRVNMYRDRGAIAGAFRLISARIPTVEELNLPPILNELTRHPRGLILMTGPTGCGKSTSLAAMINTINNERSVHIITIEDPIEYLHTHKLSVINQRELGQDTRAFANALRACLREDPDVILVGEMRDPETIALAITAAETGHLVFATLHTNNSAESIDRIIDVFPPGQQEQIRVQLANNVQAVISQQLLPRAGQPGRLPACEIMIATPAIRNLIRENKTHQIPSMVQTGGVHGMQSMDQHLRSLYNRGLITFEEAMSRAMNVEELKKMITPGGAAGEGRPQPSGKR